MIRSKYILFFSFIFILLFTTVSKAQIYEEFDVDKQTENGEKAEEKRKVNPAVENWFLTSNGAFQKSGTLDTLLDYFQVYHPVFLNPITSTYLGNYGLPGVDNNFFNRKSNVDFLFLRTRESYLLTPATIQFYNTHTPFTRLDFSQSGNRTIKNETRFNVFHSQNVNPYLNFTADINLAKSAGQYTHQESKNNFISIYSSYNKDNWNIYSGFISNLVKNNENGGLANDSLLFNGAETELLNVNLSTARSQFNGNYFFASGEYRFGKFIDTDKDSGLFIPTVGFLYNLQYERHKQIFVDEEEPNNFFDNTYFGSDYTQDSIRFYRFNNVFQIKQYENPDKKVTFGKRAFMGIDFVKTSSPSSDTAVYGTMIRNYSNLNVGGGIFRETGKFWNWNFDGKIYLIGEKAGQTELNGMITKPFRVKKDSAAAIVISGLINNMAPDYFQQEFYSNHYFWKNDLKMEQRMEVNGSIISPGYNLKLSGNYALINNFIYNNYEGIPSQTGKELLILSAYADKDFVLKRFHLRTRILWQKASDEEYIHIPDFSAFISAYYKFVISKVMFTQIGVDTRYNTKYYADDYSPATGFFYLQNEKKYGNYPYIDVYANLRLKRTRAFFKMTNIGTNFLDGEYMAAPHYPMPRSSFRFGLSWLFYD